MTGMKQEAESVKRLMSESEVVRNQINRALEAMFTV